MKQRKILLLLSNGFEILEASAFIDVMGWNLEEGNKTTRLFTAAMGNEVSSSFNMHFKVDFTLDWMQQIKKLIQAQNLTFPYTYSDL